MAQIYIPARGPPPSIPRVRVTSLSHPPLIPVLEGPTCPLSLRSCMVKTVLSRISY